MDLDGLGPEGRPLDLGPDGVLVLQSEREVQTSGTGFRGGSEVDLFVDPPVGAPRLTSDASWLQRIAFRASNGIYVGTVRVDANGSFKGTAPLPDDIGPGDHVVQAVGFSPTSQTRAMNLGVRVDPSLILDKGTRKADGRHDRIRTTGSSSGFEPGTRLTPWIRYTGQKSFTKGIASVTVQTDGTFRWTRQIKKSKGIAVYVSYADTKSNRVFWAKVR